MKKICALTMVRNDDFFLKKWVAYYGKELGEENLYVYMDGYDQVAPDFCKNINIFNKEKVIYPSVVISEKKRLAFLSEKAKELFERYDVVIGTDADEFLVVDPARGISLKEYLSEVKSGTSISGLGIDVGQHLDKEVEIDLEKPLLGQRSFGYLSTRYTKPNTLLAPIRWGSGFHRVKHHNYHIGSDLFLFHFGSMDYNILKRRNDSNGWSERHFRKRARTINIVSSHEIRPWDKTVKKARCIQTIFRQIQAPNKPSMAFRKWVVEIPERFHGIL